MKLKSGDNNHEQCLLSLRVIPRAKHNQVIGFMPDGRLKIKIKSPPVDGKANNELIIYLAKLLGIKKGAIELLSGDRTRDKRILLKGVGEREFRARLMKVSSNGKH